MSNTLTGLFVKDSYGRVVQFVSGTYYDGFGNPLTPPPIQSASYALSSSYANFASGGSGSFSGSFSASYVDFDTSWNGVGVPPWLPGRLFYNSTDEALTYYNDVSDVSIQIGQETVIRARNATGVTILNGAPVRVEGALGSRPKIVLAESHPHTPFEPITHAQEILGIATHDILNNTDGFVTVRGIVRGINLSNYSEGEILYVSSSAGELTNIKPSAPYNVIPVGTVTVANNNGQLFVNPRNPIHFHDITGIFLTDPVNDKSVLMYDSSSNVWTNKRSYNITDYSIVSSSKTLTIEESVVEVIQAFTTQSLPSAINNTGKEFSIINVSSGSIMIKASGSETIGNNYLSNDTFLIVYPEDAPRLVSNNSNWRLI